ncbi:MAG: diacylglycerol kinase family protein [Reyranellaceae bacterium]
MSQHTSHAVQSGQYRLGVIVNVRSGRNRSGTRALDALLARHPQMPVERPATPNATAAALAALAASGVNLVAICGGDGTVQQVLNVVLGPGTPFSQVPLLAVLPGGTTNMIAHDLNEANRPAAVLERILLRLYDGRLDDAIVERPVIRLTGGDAATPAYGLFFGAAGVLDATMQNRRNIDRMGIRDGTGPALRIAAVMLKLLTGRDPFEPRRIGIAIDGRPREYFECVALLASTMQSLALGIMPFWGDGPGRIRLSFARSGARSRVLAVLRALRARPGRFLSSTNGYYSLNADRVELSFDGGCVLDGELFRASEQSPIVLETAAMLRFLPG